jgi:predicted ATP-binding protein involved in virulence
MNTTPLLRLDRLVLRNFRCFAECTIDWHPTLTVLVAENGRGKTTLLDAAGIALNTFIATLRGMPQGHGFTNADVRVVQAANGDMTSELPTEFDADGCVNGQQVHWNRALHSTGRHSRTTVKNTAVLRNVTQALRSSIARDSTPPLLPLVAFYGTGRLWSEHRLTQQKKQFATDDRERTAGYVDCLSSSSSFKGLSTWYENKMREARDPRFAAVLKRNLSLLAGVQEAIRTALEPTGWSALDWDPLQGALSVRHPDHGQLPLSALSDGVRNMIALVADIARRCASLNSHLSEDAARQTPGVLLVDEIDMHLHPRWQQRVVELLRRTFPNIQMLLTTHSPHVLSTVDRECIRVISLQDGRGVVETPSFQTRGIESADVLSAIMRVDPIPQIEEAAWLSTYRALIERDEASTAAGAALLAKLNGHFGETHPVMLDCARLLRFQSFRRTRSAAENV